MVKNKQCLACREKFSYCPDCSRIDALKPAWASQFCSESCKDLWLTLTRFGMNSLTKSEAKAIICDLDLKPIDAYVDCVKRDYAKVMAEEKKARRAQKKVEPVEVQVEQEVADTHEVVLKENE